MSDYYTLVNKERTVDTIGAVQDPKVRNAITLLVGGIEQFFREQPSQLRSSFDLAFFVEVLKDRVELACRTMTGGVEPMGWGDEEDFTRTFPVLDPAADFDVTGIRRRQAANYVASRSDRRLQGALLTFINGAYVRQRPGGRLISGEPMVILRPDSPFDYLFMVMAIDYALRVSQPARVALEGS